MIEQYPIPLYTRASDLKIDCWGRWILDKVDPEEGTAGWFILGNALHGAIEQAILEGWDNPDALVNWSQNYIEEQIEGYSPENVRWSTGARAKRGADTVMDDAERMARHWFEDVHPDSPKRMNAYKDLSWPPSVEIPIERKPERTAYSLYTTGDALFHRNDQPIIVDWKSGSSMKDPDIQLWTYYYGLRKWETDVFEGWFHYLEQRKTKPALPYPGDEFIESQIAFAEATKVYGWETGTYQFKSDWYCNYCAHKDTCPVFHPDSGFQNLYDRLSDASVITEPEEAE